MTLAEPTFPPLLDGRVVIKGDDPVAMAIAGAQSGELGAGDTLWLQDPNQVELAIVLEPDVALAKAVQMLPLSVAAAGDCLASLTPPQVGVQYRWPSTLLINGAEAGKCSLTAPAECDHDRVPTWLVLGFSLRFAFDIETEPGITPGVTSLSEEGGEELNTIIVVESFARHFLSLLDTWNNEGFAAIADNWRGRVEAIDAAIAIVNSSGAISGRILGLDEDGNLLIKPTAAESAASLSLIDCINRDGQTPDNQSKP